MSDQIESYINQEFEAKLNADQVAAVMMVMKLFQEEHEHEEEAKSLIETLKTVRFTRTR